jgi:hypothetical protein
LQFIIRTDALYVGVFPIAELREVHDRFGSPLLKRLCQRIVRYALYAAEASSLTTNLVCTIEDIPRHRLLLAAHQIFSASPHCYSVW